MMNAGTTTPHTAPHRTPFRLTAHTCHAYRAWRDNDCSILPAAYYVSSSTSLISLKQHTLPRLPRRSIAAVTATSQRTALSRAAPSPCAILCRHHSARTSMARGRISFPASAAGILLQHHACAAPASATTARSPSACRRYHERNMLTH